MNLSRLMRSRWLEIILRLAVGGIFVYAGSSKLRDPLAFADSVGSFRVLPSALIGPFALAMPVFEIGAGLLVIAGWHKRAGALGLLILSGIFCLALASTMVRGISVNCGCFGASPLAGNPVVELVRDVVIAAACAFLYGYGIAERLRQPEP